MSYILNVDYKTKLIVRKKFEEVKKRNMPETQKSSKNICLRRKILDKRP